MSAAHRQLAHFSPAARYRSQGPACLFMCIHTCLYLFTEILMSAHGFHVFHGSGVGWAACGNFEQGLVLSVCGGCYRVTFFCKVFC